MNRKQGAARQRAEPAKTGSFWTSIPGICTGIAALLSATAALVTAVVGPAGIAHTVGSAFPGNQPAKHATHQPVKAPGPGRVERIAISEPGNGADVKYELTVKGTALVNPPNQLWVLGYAPGVDRWYFPDPPSPPVAPDGSWSVYSPLGDGTGTDTGFKFTIAALVVSPTAGETLHNALESQGGPGYVTQEPPSIVSNRIEVKLTCGTSQGC